MTNIPMTAAELADVLQKAQEEEITVSAVDKTRGTVHGDHPIDWRADYAWNNGSLTIVGHGMFGGRIESQLTERITGFLMTMRAQS